MKNDLSNGQTNDLPTANAQRALLAEQPRRRSRRRVSGLLFLLCGGLLILGAGGMLAGQLTSPTSTPVISSSSTSTNSSSLGKQAAGCTGAREPVDVIMQQTAQGLHLTVAQVQARVLAGKTIAQIATEQGRAATQLHNIEVQALQYANNRWLRMGCITQQDIQDNMQRDTGSATYMDEEFTHWFQG